MALRHALNEEVYYSTWESGLNTLVSRDQDNTNFIWNPSPRLLGPWTLMIAAAADDDTDSLGMISTT